MGRLERVLYVNLTERTTEARSRPELFNHYIGGAGVASKLLLEECPENVAPYASEAPIILATGPLAGIFPNMTKAVAMFKSPLTGNLGESYAGGNFSLALRMAEYGALVIKGRTNEPLSLIVRKEEPGVEDASSLWNHSPPHVQENVTKRMRKAASVITIGRAGENRVSYASTIVDRYSHFGRLGLGAVMGSKKLKAVIVERTDDGKQAENSETLELRNRIERLIDETQSMKKYKDLGTAANVLPLNAIGALPTRNFAKSTYDKADDISGENFARTVLEKKTTCPSCSVACVHLGKIGLSDSPGHKETSPSEKQLIPYNYQPIFALGTNLEVSDPEAVLRLIGCCERLAMDAMMTGTVLAWATEAYERHLVGPAETMNLEPAWRDIETYLGMMEHITNATNEFYGALARGVDAAAERYGGKDFAVSLGKNSPAGYFTGYGHVVGTLVGARHSHLSNSGYSIDQISPLSSLGPEGTVDALVEEEDWLNILNSLVACYFSRGVYTKSIVVEALATVGINRTGTELRRLGREISDMLYNYKLREGFDLRKENIPTRLLEVAGPAGRLNPEIIARMISHYVKIREHEAIQCSAYADSLP